MWHNSARSLGGILIVSFDNMRVCVCVCVDTQNEEIMFSYNPVHRGRIHCERLKIFASVTHTRGLARDRFRGRAEKCRTCRAKSMSFKGYIPIDRTQRNARHR